MFKENKKITGQTDTLIGQGSSIEGKLDCRANLRIEGKIHGEINCLGQVVVGETGEARSNITGAEVVIAGKVLGDITTQGRLTITSSGQVIGNVHVTRLIIVEGGLLNGTSKMEKPASAASPSQEKHNQEKLKKAAQPEAG